MGVFVKPVDGEQRVVIVSHLWPQVVDLYAVVRHILADHTSVLDL